MAMLGDRTRVNQAFCHLDMRLGHKCTGAFSGGAKNKINPFLLHSPPTRMPDSWLSSVTGISSYKAAPCHRDIEEMLDTG